MSDIGMTVGLIKALAPKPDPADIKQSVEDWLDDHPEATTTVQDGAITKAKLNASLQETVDDVDELKSALEANDKKVYGTLETEFGTKNEIVSGEIIYTFTEEQLEMIRSITSSDSITFFGKNIFDQSTRVSGKIKNDSNQEVDDIQSCYFSQYIPCTGKKIRPNFKIQRIYRYDSSKNLIERTYWNSTDAYTIPSGTYFVQIQIENTQLTNTMAIWYGNVEPTYSDYQESNSVEDVFGEVNVVSNGTSVFSLTLGKLNQLDDITKQIAKETVSEVFGTMTIEETDYIITVSKDVFGKVTNIASDDSVSFFGLNILDQSTEVFRHIKNDSGNVVEDYSSSYFSQFIPCHWKVISSNFPMQRVYLFDATKTFLRRTDSSNTRTSFTIPDDVYFIQIQIQNIDITDSLAISFGENTPTYSEYKESSSISDFDDGVNIISDGTSECTVELTIIKTSENEPHIIPAVGIYDMWEPPTVTDDYKCTPLGQATQSIPALNTLGWLGFLETYFDPYLGSYNDGYKVYREDFGLDSGAQATGNIASPVYSYVFEPKYYNKTVLLSAGMNTCEASTYFGLAYFIKALMEHTEEGMEALYNTTRFVVMPVICPSGIAHNPLLYPNSNGVRINKNFEYYGSWARLHTELGGPYPDSEIETKILKAWLNKYNGATFWLDCHSDTATHATVKDLGWVYCSDSATANKLATDKQKIKDFYQNKGYFSPGDTVTLDFFAVGKATTIYPKTNYAKDVANIPAAMMEQFEYSTAYGSDGNTNNDTYAIKHYVAMIRYMLLVMCKSDAEIVT